MEYKLAEAESRFADMIWDNEPLTSRQLVEMAAESLGWKSTTSYTVLRRLCDRGIFRNENSVVTSCISREDFYGGKSCQFVEETFDGSLPKFLAAFMGRKKLSRREIEEIQNMIDSYGNEDGDAGHSGGLSHKVAGHSGGLGHKVAGQGGIGPDKGEV